MLIALIAPRPLLPTPAARTAGLTRILGAADSVAAFAIVVDAKDDRAAAFYRTFGFMSFPSRPGRLFLLAETAAAGWRKAQEK
jgi:hypothetical protein